MVYMEMAKAWIMDLYEMVSSGDCWDKCLAVLMAGITFGAYIC